jgi:hypothetical protein
LAHSGAFFQEANLRWASEGQGDALTTVSATVLLTLSYNNLGRDVEGVTYLDAGAEMGYRLGLFGDGAGVSSSLLELEDRDTRSAGSFVAWGVFGWHRLV